MLSAGTSNTGVLKIRNAQEMSVLLTTLAEMENCDLEQHLENISANISENDVRRLANNDYGLRVEKITKLDGYDDLNFYLAPPVIQTNTGTCLKEWWPHGYVMKIINWRESKEEDYFHECTNILLHLKNEAFSCPYPIKNKTGAYISYWIDPELKYQSTQEQLEARKHIILLLTYIPGTNLEKIGYNEKIIFTLGRLLSQLHVTLLPFRSSKFLHRPNYTWSLMSVPVVVGNPLKVIKEEEKRLLVKQNVEEFVKTVLPNLNLLKQGVIHGDINYANVLVQRQAINGKDDVEISGIIDFTDMHISYYLFDIAIAACYVGLAHADCFEDAVSLFLVGYQKRMHITELEFRLLKACICARLCQTLVLGLQSLIIKPDNDYIKNSLSQIYGWELLNKLSKISNEEFVDTLSKRMSNFSYKFVDTES